MPESDATDKEQQPPLIEEPWQDKVLGDAIGYTKSLVSVLDSLSEGFRRRGRELEEHRHRLAILQNERRAILQERAGLEAQIGALVGERDGLRSKVGAQEREIARLREELSHGQATQEAGTPEIQELRAAAQDSNRQAEELREIVRSLERQLLQARQSAVRSQRMQVAGDLVTPERPLKTGPADVADSSGLAPEIPRPEEARIGALVAERDGLRSTMEAQEREIAELREELSHGQATLEARTQESEELQVAMAEATRQVEDLRQTVQELRQERERDAQSHAARAAEIEGELQRAREAAMGASQEQTALRENLISAETQLETARQDLADARKFIPDLRRTVDEERSRTVLLQKQFGSQAEEIARLKATVRDARTLLGEIAGILGGTAEPARRDGEASRKPDEGSESVELIEGPEGTADHTQKALTILRTIVRAVQGVVGTADDPTTGSSRLAPESAPMRLSVQQIADQWRLFQQEREKLIRWQRQLQEENARLSGQLAALLRERETREERQRPTPALDRRAGVGEAASEQGPAEKGPRPAAADMKMDSPTQASPPTSPRKVSRRGSPLVGKSVECVLEGSGEAATRTLRGKISKVNPMGLMGMFEERLPEGRRVVIRFTGEADEFSRVGRVVRVRQSSTASAVPVVYHHLIRFESPLPNLPQ